MKKILKYLIIVLFFCVVIGRVEAYDEYTNQERTDCREKNYNYSCTYCNASGTVTVTRGACVHQIKKNGTGSALNVFCLEGDVGFKEDTGKYLIPSVADANSSTYTYYAPYVYDSSSSSATLKGDTITNAGFACALVKAYNKNDISNSYFSESSTSTTYDTTYILNLDATTEDGKEQILKLQEYVWEESNNNYNNKTCATLASSDSNYAVTKAITTTAGNLSITKVSDLAYDSTSDSFKGTISITSTDEAVLSIQKKDSKDLPSGIAFVNQISGFSSTYSETSPVTDGKYDITFPAKSSSYNDFIVNFKSDEIPTGTGTQTITAKFTKLLYVNGKTVDSSYANRSQSLGIPYLTVNKKYNVTTKDESVVFTVPTGKIVVTKVDSADATKKLSGSTLALQHCYSGTCTTVDTKTTGTTGVVEFTGLAYGKYQVVETTAPTGYVKSTTPVSVTLDASSKSINFQNTQYKGTLNVIKKETDTSTTLAGAKFKLVNNTTKSSVEATTNSSGVATFTNLDINATYTLSETTAPAGYELISDTKVISFASASSTDYVLTHTVWNDPIKINIQKKAFKTKEALTGAKFVIKDTSGNTLKEVTNTTEFKINAGTYYLIEETAPEGYKKIDKVLKFSVSDKGAISIVGVGTLSGTTFTETAKTDERFEASGEAIIAYDYPLTKIFKKNMSDKGVTTGYTNGVANNVIEITNSFNSDKISFTTTSSSYELYLKATDEGEYYYLQETKAATGYEKLDIVFQFTVSDTGVPKVVSIGYFDSKGKYHIESNTTDYAFVNKANKTLIIYNDKIKTIISKQDSSSKKDIEGAHLVIKDAENKTILYEFDSTSEPWEQILDKVVADSDGNRIFYLTETQAPEGYDILDIEYKLNIKKNGDIELLSSNTDNIVISKNEIILYNSKTDVPDTAKSSNKYTIIAILGSLLAVFGGLIATITMKKSKQA